MVRKRIVDYIHYVTLTKKMRAILMAAAEHQFELDGKPDEDFTHPYNIVKEHKNWLNPRDSASLERLITFLDKVISWEYPSSHRIPPRTMRSIRNRRNEFVGALREFKIKYETGEAMGKSGYQFDEEQKVKEAVATLTAMNYMAQD